MTSTEKSVFWRNHIQAQEQSNLTQAQYCKQQNIICNRLVYWRVRFRKDLAKKNIKAAPKNNFVKLGIVNAKPEMVALVLIDGNRLEIPSTLVLTLLPNLLSALKPTT